MNEMKKSWEPEKRSAAVYCWKKKITFHDAFYFSPNEHRNNVNGGNGNARVPRGKRRNSVGSQCFVGSFVLRENRREGSLFTVDFFYEKQRDGARGCGRDLWVIKTRRLNTAKFAKLRGKLAGCYAAPKALTKSWASFLMYFRTEKYRRLPPCCYFANAMVLIISRHRGNRRCVDNKSQKSCRPNFRFIVHR